MCPLLLRVGPPTVSKLRPRGKAVLLENLDHTDLAAEAKETQGKMSKHDCRFCCLRGSTFDEQNITTRTSEQLYHVRPIARPSRYTTQPRRDFGVDQPPLRSLVPPVIRRTPKKESVATAVHVLSFASDDIGCRTCRVPDPTETSYVALGGPTRLARHLHRTTGETGESATGGRADSWPDNNAAKIE